VHSLLLFLNGISNTLLLLRQSEIIKSQFFTGYDTPKIVHVLINIIDLIGPYFITSEETISVIYVFYLWAGPMRGGFCRYIGPEP
jgi:hypothetical protein